jgi:uncharacterized protein
MSRVVHFEIHATTPPVLIEFYSTLFGWTFQQWGNMKYWVIDTGKKTEPGIDGGLVPRRGPAPSPAQPVGSFVCTVQVDGLDAVIAKAVSLGGAIALPKMPVPTVGWLAYVKDPDGNLLGLMQPDPQAA